MKRSEVLTKLAHKLWIESDIYQFETAERLAEVVLKEVEMLGMVPPRIIKLIPGMTYPFSVFEWENEK